MMYSDIGRLNCNVSFTTFATPIRGQVYERLYLYLILCCVLLHLPSSWLFEVAFQYIISLGFCVIVLVLASTMVGM